MSMLIIPRIKRRFDQNFSTLKNEAKQKKKTKKNQLLICTRIFPTTVLETRLPLLSKFEHQQCLVFCRF